MINKLFPVMLLSIISLPTEAQKKTFSFEEELNVSAPLKLKATTFEGNISVSTVQKGNFILSFAVSKKGQIIELTKAEFEQHFIFTLNNIGNNVEINCAINDNEKKKYWREEIEVSFNLKVPKETSCDLYTMKGNFEITGLTGNQKCSTSEGNIEVERTLGGLILESSIGNILLKDIEGTVLAYTLNGKIQGNINVPRDSIICNSDNGTINLIIPGNTQADLFLKGKLINSTSTNFTGTFERTLVVGKLNGGGIPVRLIGKNGNVSLFYK